MFKICLENRVVRNDIGYKCYLCQITQDNDFELMKNHINTQGHIKRVNMIAQEQKQLEEDNLCLLSETQRKTLVENFVTFDRFNFTGSSFKCHLCKCLISGLKNIFQHTKGRSHQDILKVKTSKSKEVLKSNQNGIKSKTLINKSKNPIIHLDNQYDKCTICNCKVGKKCVQEHIQGGNHQRNILSQQLNTKKSSDIEVKEKNENSISETHVSEIKYCLTCEHPLKSIKSLQNHVMVHVLQESNLRSDIIKCTQSNGKDTVVKCLLCNIFLTNGFELDKHVTSALHASRLTFFSFIKEFIKVPDIENINMNDFGTKIENCVSNTITDMYFCTMCKITISHNNINDHIQSKQHTLNLSSYSSGLEDKVQIQLNLVNLFYLCYMCNESFKSFQDLINHYNQDKHKQKIKCLDTIFKDPKLSFVEKKAQTKVLCKHCDIILNNCGIAMQHIFGSKHQKQIQIVNNQSGTSFNMGVSNVPNQKVSLDSNVNKNKFETVDTQNIFNQGNHNIITVNAQTSSVKVSCPQTIDNLLDGLISMDLKESDKQKLPNSARPKNSIMSPTLQSKINIFNKNVMHYGKDYINLCIEPGEENIYQIELEQIQLMKLGASLSFTWKSKQLCLPCNKQLEVDKQLLFEHLQDLEHINNLQHMEEDDAAFIDYPDQFSDLRLAKLYMAEECHEWIYCFACDVKVKNDNSDICLHTEMSRHMERSQELRNKSKVLCEEYLKIFENVWYYAQKFICEICSHKCDYEIDFIIHLIKPNHLNQIEKQLSKGVELKFDFCHVCITYWFGKHDSHKIHCDSLFHKRFANNGDFMIPKMFSMTTDLLDNVDAKIVFLITESDKINFEKYKELELLKSIEDTVKHLYPDAKAYTFGSRLSNLGFPDSDVDVFLDCQDLYYKNTTQEESKAYLLNVRDSFETNSKIWIADEILLSTRVPIIKLRHIPTGLKCDISFINGLSVEKSTLVGNYNQAYPICRHLILYLKKWLTSCKLAGSESITTFAISWLVIYYLQVKGILPNVHDVIRLKNKSKIVDGWECGFESSIPATHSNLQFKDHLKELFYYYANFDYKKYVICPYLGLKIEKRNFAYPENLSNDLALYKCRLTADNSLTFRFDSPMCIQDPIDLSQNLTKAVKKLQLRCFQQYCTESYAKL